MPNREWERELEFSEDELADMGAELYAGDAADELPAPGAPRRKKRSTLRVPVDVVPRRASTSSPPTSAPVSATGRLAQMVARKPVVETASDRVVERALNGGAGGGPVSEPIAIGRPAVAARARPTDEVDLTIEMTVEPLAPGEPAPPQVTPQPRPSADDESAEELDADALEEEAEPVLPYGDEDVEVDVDVDVESELPERADPTEPQGVRAVTEEQLPAETPTLPPPLPPPPLELRPELLAQLPAELPAEPTAEPPLPPPPPSPNQAAPTPAPAPAAFPAPARPPGPPSPPSASMRSEAGRMPPPPTRESRTPLAVDVIAAALSAPRPLPPPHLEDEEELSSEELEVVSESSAAVAELTQAAQRAGVTSQARAIPPSPPPTPIPAADRTVAERAQPAPDRAPPPVPPALPATAQGAPPPMPSAPPLQASAQTQAQGQAPAQTQTPTPALQPTLTPPITTRRRRRAKAWFEEIFDEDYLRTLPFMTPRQTHREADFIEAGLEVPKGAQILDLGCGYGRHALELAARGHNVVGLDLSLPLLIRAADEAQRRGLTVNFVHGDMRELTFEEQFDGAYCILTTFGYFDDDTNRKVAQGVGRSLKPRGRFLVEVLNRDYIVADLPTRVWWEGDGCVVLEEVDFNYYTSRVVSRRSVVFEDGRQLEQEISIRAYSLHELGKVLHHAGFRVTEVSGALATRGRFFGASSRELLVVAEKRPG